MNYLLCTLSTILRFLHEFVYGVNLDYRLLFYLFPTGYFKRISDDSALCWHFRINIHFLYFCLSLSQVLKFAVLFFSKYFLHFLIISNVALNISLEMHWFFSAKLSGSVSSISMLFLKLQLILLSACSTLGRDQRNITPLHPIGIRWIYTYPIDRNG